MQKMSKEALIELKKIADKVWVSLKDLLFGTWDNIIVLKNEATKENVKKEVSENQITMETQIENWAMRTVIRVPDNYQSDSPLRFCFILDQKWIKQAVQPTWYVWKNAKVKIFAYCFGVEYEVTHWDWKIYHLDEWASLEVYEFNYNSDQSLWQCIILLRLIRLIMHILKIIMFLLWVICDMGLQKERFIAKEKIQKLNLLQKIEFCIKIFQIWI